MRKAAARVVLLGAVTLGAAACGTTDPLEHGLAAKIGARACQRAGEAIDVYDCTFGSGASSRVSCYLMVPPDPGPGQQFRGIRAYPGRCRE
jgi:hypothetical protein